MSARRLHPRLLACALPAAAAAWFAAGPRDGTERRGAGPLPITLIPRREGACSVRIAGPLSGTAITTAADIERPEAADEYPFPAVDPSAPELPQALDHSNAALEAEHANATALDGRVSALESGGGRCAAGSRCACTSPTLIAYAGLAAGAAGLLVELTAMRKGTAPK